MNKQHHFSNTYLILLSCLLFISCQNNSVPLSFLKPSINVNSDQILDLDLQRDFIDIPMYSINIEDTIITFALTHDSTKVISQSWKVTFINADSILLNDFLRKKNTIICSRIEFSKLGFNNIALYNYKRNMTFLGTIKKENDNYILEITYHFPYKEW